jgi:hypothetical protein
MNEGNKESIIAALIATLKNDNPDSLEIGTASKGGGLKIYGNFERPEEFKKRIDNALELRAYAAVTIGYGKEEVK